MPLRCAILDDYQNVALTFADWSTLKDKIDITVFDKPFTSQDEAVRALQDFEIVCAMRERTPFSREVLSALPKLKLLLTSGMRNASFDLEAAKERGITVCGTGGVGNATAGLTIGLMLELTRKIGFENARMHAGEPWQTTMGQDVEGMTLGVVGLGKLGTKVATIAKALGMNVIAWSQNLTPEACAAAGVSYATKDELFATADIVTIHTILSKRTRGLITRDDLARMKPTSYLVNTARGPIVDEAALLDALQRKAIAGAGLDTFSVEPLPLDHPLRKLDNVVLTPHLGYVTENNYRRYYGDMVEDIAAWLGGAPVRVMT
ncbi:MAG: D-2-hydroxyacid dehydrogenase family protein [Candidatus Afipia apatlaquensis]|uniref:D-2-hydroxyacid dehydrogenase family protein n=1 Tax=Candidatus Afipia apatlaquensis TaxID=2712852 RepID=A0A7C9VME8_9BRAD|nr:D-2-hydroxyacid dehydrogenase family protein [Candidatus Afipia apatlaquensis]